MNTSNSYFSKLFLFTGLFIVCTGIAQAQPDLSVGDGLVNDFARTIINWVKIVIGVGCAIGLSHSTYKIFNGDPSAKNQFVGWVVGLGVWWIGFTIIENSIGI